ncbi:MAG: hypothetical protein R3E79_48670 [Caldilineaceae bacterium]
MGQFIQFDPGFRQDLRQNPPLRLAQKSQTQASELYLRVPLWIVRSNHMQTINTNITTGLVVIVLALLGYLLVLSLRRPVLAKLGLRNIPRRPAQSTLIVLGLTLSTIIIVSALSTGDTLSYSLRRQAVGAYGQIDEIIAPPLLSMLITLGVIPSSRQPRTPALMRPRPRPLTAPQLHRIATRSTNS